MATHAHSRSQLDLPNPLRAAAPLLALAVLALLFEIDPRLPWLVGVVAAGCFAAAAAVRVVRARQELAAVRRTADRLIVHDPRSRDASELVRWRCEELTAPSARDALRREIERTLAEVDPRLLPGASPLRRPAVRANEAALREIAARVGNSRPVSPRGVLLTQALLRDGASPLYSDQAELLLPRTLARILGALEP
jgi:hypothetical protein